MLFFGKARLDFTADLKDGLVVGGLMRWLAALSRDRYRARVVRKSRVLRIHRF